MKKLIIFLVLSLGFSVWPQKVFAQNELLKSGEVIDADYIRAGDTVQIDGEIKGDAFLAGGIVTVNGKIGGDLFILGGKVNINGEVGNSIRVLGGDVTVNSVAGRNVLTICGSCTVTKQTLIGGSLIGAGANMELSASKIGRGFRFFGSRLYLNSEINNEAYVVADKEFLLGSQASVSSTLKYTGSSEVIMQPGSTVAGNIAYEKTTLNETYPRFFGARTILNSYHKFQPIVEVLGFGVSALIGFLFLGLFPKIFEKTVTAMEFRPAASISWGLVIFLMIPVLAALFAVTIIGIPLSLVLIFLGCLAWLGSLYLTAFFLGRKIMLPKFGERRGWALLLGLFLIQIISLVPVIGGLVKLFLVLFALGAVALSYKQPALLKERVLHRGRRS